eukprot:CFRG3399T1
MFRRFLSRVLIWILAIFMVLVGADIHVESETDTTTACSPVGSFGLNPNGYLTLTVNKWVLTDSSIGGLYIRRSLNAITSKILGNRDGSNLCVIDVNQYNMPKTANMQNVNSGGLVGMYSHSHAIVVPVSGGCLLNATVVFPGLEDHLSVSVEPSGRSTCSTRVSIHTLHWHTAGLYSAYACNCDGEGRGAGRMSNSGNITTPALTQKGTGVYLRGHGAKEASKHTLLTYDVAVVAYNNGATVVYPATKEKTDAILLFAVLLLIGSGAFFVKHSMSVRDRNVLYVVLLLQVLSNILYAILEETKIGRRDGLSDIILTNVVYLFDFACCIAVWYVMIGVIKHLQLAAEDTDKAAISVHKLSLFTNFYTVAMVYVYISRLAIPMVKESIPYNYIWMTDVLMEAMTLAVFAALAFWFRPSTDNPYFNIPQNDDIDMEELEVGHENNAIGEFDCYTPSSVACGYPTVDTISKGLDEGNVRRIRHVTPAHKIL